MIVDMDKRELDILINELEKTSIPELRTLIVSDMRKALRDELKQDELALRELVEKLKAAA